MGARQSADPNEICVSGPIAMPLRSARTQLLFAELKEKRSLMRSFSSAGMAHHRIYSAAVCVTSDLGIGRREAARTSKTTS